MASTEGFKSNRSFDSVSVFSGDHGQSFRQWSAEYMAKEDMRFSTITYASSA